MKTRFFILTALSASVLAACSSSHSPEFQEDLDSVRKNTDGTFQERIKEHTPQRHEIGQVKRGPVYHDVDNYSLIERDERRLPEVFEQEAFIKDEGDAMTIDEFSALIYRSYGIALDVSSPDLAVLSNENNTDFRERGGRSSPFRTIGRDAGAGVGADSVGEYDQSLDLIGDKAEDVERNSLKLKPFEFEGTVRELLDYVTILNGLKWSYDDDFNKAYMYAYETRTFLVHDFGGNRQEQTRITTSTQQDAESTSGGSNRQTSRNSNIDIWEEIKESINGMLSPEDVGRATFNEKAGMVTVTDSDYVLSRISKYIDSLNHNVTRPVTVQYSIIRFNYSEGDNKGINQNYLNNRLTSSMLGDYSAEIGAGALSPNPAGNLGAFQQLVGGNFLSLATDSHELLMGFLNEIGTAEVAYSKQVEIMNNDIYTHQGGDNQEYISSIERSTYREGAGQENITTEKDVAVDGVNISIKPRVVGDQIRVDYSIAYSDFIGLTDAGLGAGLEGVKLKQDSSLDISHNALLKNGEFKIVEYTDETSKTSGSQGFLDHGFWFFGGNENRNVEKSVFIVTMAAFYSN
jgi:type IVB pilus formation R64 PilN family outer membrane protein